MSNIRKCLQHYVRSGTYSLTVLLSGGCLENRTFFFATRFGFGFGLGFSVRFVVGDVIQSTEYGVGDTILFFTV